MDFFKRFTVFIVKVFRFNMPMEFIYTVKKSIFKNMFVSFMMQTISTES